MRATNYFRGLILVAAALVSGAASADQFEVTIERFRNAVTADFFNKSYGYAVFPTVGKGAIGIGGHKGNGVISCRSDDGWSPPAFIKITGGSLGLQIGGEESDLVLFFMTKRGVESLLETKFTLGGEAGVAAGPFGASAETNTDLRFRAEIYAYARSRGLFAGLSIEGGSLTVNQKAIKRYYGERIWPEEILFEHQVPHIPPEARAFMDVLPNS